MINFVLEMTIFVSKMMKQLRFSYQKWWISYHKWWTNDDFRIRNDEQRMKFVRRERISGRSSWASESVQNDYWYKCWFSIKLSGFCVENVRVCVEIVDFLLKCPDSVLKTRICTQHIRLRVENVGFSAGLTTPALVRKHDVFCI